MSYHGYGNAQRSSAAARFGRILTLDKEMSISKEPNGKVMQGQERRRQS